MIILMYHGILPDDETSPILSYGKIHRSSFEWQMRWLQRNAAVLSLADVVREIQLNNKLPPRATVLTFDDGYKNNFDIAFPILEKYQLPATFFVSLCHIDPGSLLWFNVLTAKTYVDTQLRENLHNWREYYNNLNRQFLDGILSDNVSERYGHYSPVGFPQEKFEVALAGMTREELFQISGSPLIEIGSHTISHPRLTQCTPERIQKELLNSKTELESITHKPIRFLAYPQGDYDSFVIQMAQQAGYASAVAVDIAGGFCRGETLYNLPRVGIYHEEKFYFIIKWLGLQKIGRWFKKVVLHQKV
jgi:peptidoglycan/xylan/chitin deacetylase (PgdA/CDA1 family)